MRGWRKWVLLLLLLPQTRLRVKRRDRDALWRKRLLLLLLLGSEREAAHLAGKVLRDGLNWRQRRRRTRVVSACGSLLTAVGLVRRCRRRRTRRLTSSRTARATGTTVAVDALDVGQQLVRRLHRHATKVGDEVDAVRVSSDAAF